MNANIKADEIDFREVFNILWMSKLQILLITSIVFITSIVYQIVQTPDYESNFNVRFGSYQVPSTKCETDIFKIYRCYYKDTLPLNFYSTLEIKTINSNLQEKFESNANLNLNFIPLQNSININIKSDNQEKISKKILELAQFFNEKDDALIEQISFSRNYYLNSLVDYISFVENLNDTDGLIKNKINSVSLIKNDLNDLISDETSILKSTTSPTKIILQQKITLKNLVFSTFLGLFISILITLFRARERVNQ